MRNSPRQRVLWLARRRNSPRQRVLWLARRRNSPRLQRVLWLARRSRWVAQRAWMFSKKWVVR